MLRKYYLNINLSFPRKPLFNHIYSLYYHNELYNYMRYGENSGSLELSTKLTKVLGFKKRFHILLQFRNSLIKLDIKHICFIDKLLNSLFSSRGLLF